MQFASYLSPFRRAIDLWSIALLLIFGASVVQASPYNRALQSGFYKSFAADINDDGAPDALLKSNVRMVTIPIDDDLLIPLRLSPKSPTFVLLSNTDGTYSLITNPGDSIVNSEAWNVNSHDLVYGDVLGSGIGSMLIRGRTQGMPSFVVATSEVNGQPYLVQQLTTSNIGIDISAPGTNTMLTDKNSDKRTDLLVRVNGRLALIL